VGALFAPLAPIPFAIPFLIIGQALISLGGTAYNITVISLRQAITPDRFQGRVNASQRVLVNGLSPFGSLLGGVLGQILGLRPTLAIAAVGWLLATVWLYQSPVRGLLGTPDVLDDPATE
jgi:MFS family permease